MGDVHAQVTPETPGQKAVLNPFESPNDYCSLHEPFVSSPSLFKPEKSSATPHQFKWSIDQLAAIYPVEIDPEDVHRQALYLSHAKMDKEVEDRRQRAIEEFFTKRIIVPSPWTQHDGKQAAQFHSTKCVDLNYESPLRRAQTVTTGKNTVACQTQLSLPVDFNLERVLGVYFKAEEHPDQSQESLSNSSLRRKLFLDGQVSGSECSSPSSPPPGTYDAPPAALGVLCSIDLSPVRCRSPMQTPNSGQFSSSPIQGGRRAYSLGSSASPMFFENSPPRGMSPAFSPISRDVGKTPMAEKKKLSFLSPDTLSSSNSMVNSCSRSPLIEGCSPIKSVFARTSHVCRDSAQFRIAVPFSIEHLEEEKENSPPAHGSSPDGSIVIQLHNLDTSFPEAHAMDPLTTVQSRVFKEPENDFKENDTVEMVDPVELEDDQIWVKAAIVTDNTPVTSFMTGNIFSVETSHMCMSPLAESSVIPCDSSSSIQVDSGYTTQTCGSSLMDGIGGEGAYKESDVQFSEIQNASEHAKVKDFSALEVRGHKLLEVESPELEYPPPKTSNKLHRTLNSGTWKLSRFTKNARLQNSQKSMDGKPVSSFLQ
ncbi:protein aurora borealis [Rana temporaria]|uniref:protein aurora borealis n=1 Tax=Rana temporaria TaxID=8407 RepID=UPI001AAD3885|nr:protein aurora borealis [Rana temporaria]XP_040197297.1 protein aurora borealis [Rana temporaria]XP_040197298.1 protein aurora borealis [Rana temporaria]